MSFFAVLLALLLEQVRPLPHRAWSSGTLRSWADWAGLNFDAGRERHTWIVLWVTIFLPALAVIVVHLILAHFSVILAFVFNVAVLYVTLGFRHFSHYFSDIRAALERGDELEARRQLSEWLRIDTADLPRTELLRHVLEHSLLAAHRHVFGVFFWYIVLAALGLGPAGAVIYRLAEFAERHWNTKDVSLGEPRSLLLALRSQQLFSAMDYVPVRLTAIGFAIMGDFETAIDSWRRNASLWRKGNDGVLLAAAAGAVGVRLGDGAESMAAAVSPQEPYQGDAELLGLTAGERLKNSEGHTTGVAPEIGHLRSVVGLVWRSVLMWMFLLVLLTFANIWGR